MRILVACEFSGRVRDAFAVRGHDAWSCDIRPTESTGNHYQGDLFDILYDEWDIVIAHPPCTYLSKVGSGWFNFSKYGYKALARRKQRYDAVDFFMRIWESPCRKMAIENPVGFMNTNFRKPDQIIQPWQFGDEAQKATCLWLRGLPLLTPTLIVEKGEFLKRRDGAPYAAWYSRASSKERSKTFPGIAKAMAEQWG